MVEEVKGSLRQLNVNSDLEDAVVCALTASLPYAAAIARATAVILGYRGPLLGAPQRSHGATLSSSPHWYLVLYLFQKSARLKNI